MSSSAEQNRKRSGEVADPLSRREPALVGIPLEPGKVAPQNIRQGQEGGSSRGGRVLEGPVEELRGVYIISVAARLLEMHPQTLRKYERLGLVRPSRTLGRLRLYSEEDIVKLKLIKHLVDDLGFNLAGVEVVVEMVRRLVAVRRRLAAVREAQRMRDLMLRELEGMLALLNAELP